MRIRHIYHHQLADYIASEEFQTSPVIPISPQRAISHINNPRAEANDLVLVLIYDETDEMVAYLGVFPDELHFKDEIAHVGWLSCMWVNPKMRGQGISKKLIREVFEAWDYKILVTEFTPAAKGLYNSTKQFLDLAKPKGMRGYLRLNLHYLLPNKDPKWQKWKGFLKFIDGSFNLFNRIRLALYSSKNVPSFRYISQIDETTWQFIQQHKTTELMNRQAQDLNWMLRYPWLLQANQKDHHAKRYHFSSVSKRFNFLPIQVFHPKQPTQLIGVLILSLRNQHLKIPYAYFDEAHIDDIANLIYHHLLSEKMDMLTIFHPKLAAYFQNNKTPFFKKRTLQRHYIISKVFEQHIQNYDFTIQDGDADAAFT